MVIFEILVVSILFAAWFDRSREVLGTDGLWGNKGELHCYNCKVYDKVVTVLDVCTSSCLSSSSLWFALGLLIGACGLLSSFVQFRQFYRDFRDFGCHDEVVKSKTADRVCEKLNCDESVPGVCRHRLTLVFVHVRMWWGNVASICVGFTHVNVHQGGGRFPLRLWCCGWHDSYEICEWFSAPQLAPTNACTATTKTNTKTKAFWFGYDDCAMFCGTYWATLFKNSIPAMKLVTCGSGRCVTLIRCS